MTDVVLDASAVLAFLRNEPGAEIVRPHLKGGRLSAVNYSEVIAKAAALDIGYEQTESIMNDLGVERVAFDDRHAAVAASLLPATKRFGISLADRACMALAMIVGLPALTSDSDWTELGLEFEIRLIR